MKLVCREEVIEHKSFFVNEILRGKIFVFPTDTIYGIGCDAYNEVSVKKIRELKRRYIKPFSVVAPSKEWVFQNCVVRDKNIFNKYACKVTLIFDLRKPNHIAPSVILDENSLGIRISENWFSDLIFDADVPFVATSVNLSGDKHIDSISDLSENMRNYIDYFIDEGILRNTASKIIDVRESYEKTLR